MVVVVVVGTEVVVVAGAECVLGRLDARRTRAAPPLPDPQAVTNVAERANSATRARVKNLDGESGGLSSHDVLRPRCGAFVVGIVCLASCTMITSCTNPSRPAANRVSQRARVAAGSTSTSAAAPTTSSLPPSTSTSEPAFVGTVSTITASDVPSTYRPGCPVDPSQLRLLHMSYWGFDDQAHVGTMVVNAAVTSAVLAVFSQLYAEQFPIREMEPEDAFGGSDPQSMAADNTSGFNCRYAVAPGPPQWSVHAYGEAIDVNPVENPYFENGQWLPPAGASYSDRSDVRPGMAVAGGELVGAFASVGWYWGGRWTSSPDYQHFSATGG